METTLYVVQTPPMPKVEKPSARSPEPISNPLTVPTSPAESLKQIRRQTCYKTLRSLIDLVQLVLFIAAGLVAVVPVGMLFSPIEGLPISGKILSLVIGLAFAFIVAVLATAWKQAALLLVDIADCQICLVGKT